MGILADKWVNENSDAWLRKRARELRVSLLRIIQDAEWNLENPGNEDDTLENIITLANEALKTLEIL